MTRTVMSSRPMVGATGRARVKARARARVKAKVGTAERVDAETPPEAEMTLGAVGRIPCLTDTPRSSYVTTTSSTSELPSPMVSAYWICTIAS